MKVLGTRRLAANKIILPGDWPKVEAAPEVSARAKSIQELGCIHEPLVRRVGGEYRLIVGRHRVAAMMSLGWKEIPVKVVECEAWEAKALALAENIERRHLTRGELEDMVAAHLAIIEDRIREARPDASEQTVRAEAYKEIAAAAQVTPKSVKNAAYRRRKREAEKALEGLEIGSKVAEAVADMTPPPAPTLPPGFKTFGMELDKGAADAIHNEVQCTERAMTCLQMFIAAVRKMDLPKETLQRIEAKVSVLRNDVRVLAPNAVCPWCKGMEVAQQQCSACLGRGLYHLTRSTAVPSELKDEDDPKIAYLGKIYSAVEFHREHVDPSAEVDDEDDEDIF